MTIETKFRELLNIMARLRDPDSGCPWDLKQDFDSIAPYTIEEAYEVADAINRNDLHDLKGELGDLMLQVLFHAQMGKEAGAFDIGDVLDNINDKMTRRHPHIFGDADLTTADAVASSWEAIKAQERAQEPTKTTDSALGGVALSLPALMRAQKLAKRAARTGFDWTDPNDIFDKFDEEIVELKDAMEANDTENIEEELGDILFVIANLCRRLNVDGETALRKANDKFQMRFEKMEEIAAEKGQDFVDLSLEDQEILWQLAKKQLANPTH